MFSSVVSSKALTASENSVVLSASVASDVVFSSNVSLGAELVFDLQADNSPKETHKRKIIIAVKSRYCLSLNLAILIHPPDPNV